MDVRRALKLLSFRLPLPAIGRVARGLDPGEEEASVVLLRSRVEAAEALASRAEVASTARRPVDLDREADARSRLVHDILVAFSGPTHPLGEEAASLKEALFPDGLKAHLTLPMVKKVDENARLAAVLSERRFAGAVAQLQLSEVRRELVEANAALREVVSRSPAPSRRAVEQARQAAQDALVWVMMRRWAKLGPRQVSQAAALEALIAPVAREVEAVRQGRRRAAG